MHRCHADIGRKFWTNQATQIRLGSSCFTQSIIIHEVLHALGKLTLVVVVYYAHIIEIHCSVSRASRLILAMLICC